MNVLREARDKLGLSRNYMSRELGITDVAYRKKEDDILKFSFDEIIKISKILNISVDDIVKEANKRNTSELKYIYAKDKEYKLESYIYFIKDCSRNIVKIGKSTNLVYRISSIRSSLIASGVDPSNLRLIGLYPTIKEDVDRIEREFHCKLNQNRKVGEWFDISEIDLVRKFSIYKRIYGVNIIIDEMDCEKSINNEDYSNEYIESINKGFNCKKFIDYKREALDVEHLELDILNVLKIL